MITITVDDREVQAALNRVAQKINDLTPVMRQIGEDVLLSVKLNFEQQGRPRKWQPSRRVLEKGGETLSNTGRLRNSFTPGNSDSIFQVTPHSVTIGTNVKYAAIHQFGGPIRPRTGKALNIPGVGPRKSITMPERPFLMLQEQDRAAIVKIVERYLAAT